MYKTKSFASLSEIATFLNNNDVRIVEIQGFEVLYFEQKAGFSTSETVETKPNGKKKIKRVKSKKGSPDEIEEEFKNKDGQDMTKEEFEAKP